MPLGIVSAYRRNSEADVGTMVVANLGVSIPVFVLGLLLAFLFAIVLKGTPFALPPSGRLTAGLRSSRPIAEAWGLADSGRSAAHGARLPVEHVHRQRPR